MAKSALCKMKFLLLSAGVLAPVNHTCKEDHHMKLPCPLDTTVVEPASIASIVSMFFHLFPRAVSRILSGSSAPCREASFDGMDKSKSSGVHAGELPGRRAEGVKRNNLRCSFSPIIHFFFFFGGG